MHQGVSISITLAQAVETAESYEIGITAWELVGAVVFLLAALLITYSTFLRMPPEKARLVSSLSILGVLIVMLFYVSAQGYLGELLKQPLKENILLSSEVMGALVGSVFTVVLGAFVVDHLMESAEERSAIRATAQTHYSEKVKLLEEFAHKGQKIIYYALAYRQAEEWLLRHGVNESSERTNPKDGAAAGFGLGKVGGKETLAYYNQMQQKFVEAGSLHGMARAVESTFFTSRELSTALTRSTVLPPSGLSVEDENQLVVTKPLIEQFDRFLNPQYFKHFSDYPSAVRDLEHLSQFLAVPTGLEVIRTFIGVDRP